MGNSVLNYPSAVPGTSDRLGKKCVGFLYSCSANDSSINNTRTNINRLIAACL